MAVKSQAHLDQRTRRKTRWGTTKAAMAARVAYMSAPPPRGEGKSRSQIAAELRMSDRNVAYYRAHAKDLNLDATAFVFVPEPIDHDDLIPEALETVKAGREWLAWVRKHPGEAPTDDVVEAALGAFVKFYPRYSGLYFPEHWKEWVRAALRHDRLLLNVPPRHAKSELFSVWLPLWFVCLDRNIQILIISETRDLAKKFSTKVAWNLEWNATLVADHGRFRPDAEAAPWRPLSGELLVYGRNRQIESGDLTIQIRGLGQQILGMEADIIVADDVVGREAAESKATRMKTSNTYHGDVMTRLSPTSWNWVVGQRIHFQDLYGELAEKVDEDSGEKVYHHISTPAVLEWPSTAPDGSVVPAKVLWEREWPIKRLMRTKADVTNKYGSAHFETMYQQNPLPSEGITVQLAWITGEGGNRGCLDHDRPAGVAASPQRLLGLEDGVDIPDDLAHRSPLVRFISLDPPQERAGGLIIGDVVQDREVFNCGILEVHRLRPGIQEVHKLIREKAGYYNPDYLIIEVNQAQRWFREDPGFVAWHRRSNVRLLSHATGQNKQNAEYGLQSLSVDFEMGRIRMPYGDADGRQMSNLLIEEVTKHPHAEYDDLFMALWFPRFNLPKLVAVRHYNGRKPGEEESRFGAPPRVRRGWGRQQAVVS